MTKKKTLSISVQLCLVRCEKIQNRDSPESKKKKSGHSPLKKKSTSLAFPAWKIKALCKNGSFRWRIYDLPTNFMNEKNVSRIGREKFKKKNVFFFVLHILYSHKQISPPQYRKTKQKKIPLPLSLRKRNLIINPMIKVINSGEPNLDFKNKYHYITYLTPIQSKEGLLEPP